MISPYILPPVVGFELYRQDAVVLRQGRAGRPVDWARSDVTEFSAASRKRLAFVASNTDVNFTTMITLTYPMEFPNDGKDVKRDFATFKKAMMRRWDKPSYLWFLEFQRRGAPHIHLLLERVKVNKCSIAWLSGTWYRICDTGDEKHLRAGTRIERIRLPEGARHYVVKEASKMYQKRVPGAYQNVGRFWGCSRDVPPTARQTVSCTEDDLVGALELSGWRWLRSENINWKTLYNASEYLIKSLNYDIIGFNPIQPESESLQNGGE